MTAKKRIESKVDANAVSVESTALLGLVADIRAAVGDPTGKLMQDELLVRCRLLNEIEKAARVWWKAKGRYNSQMAACKLGELLGEHVHWPNVSRQRPLPAESDSENTNQRASG